MSNSFKKGQKVTATPVHGRPTEGTFVAMHPSSKGEWAEIKPTGGSKNFKTRPSMVTPA